MKKPRPPSCGSRAGGIELALVDIELQRGGGREVAAALRRLGVQRTLFISGHPEKLVAEGRLDPDAALVRKPFTVAGVIEVVKFALQGGPRLAETATAQPSSSV